MVASNSIFQLTDTICHSHEFVKELLEDKRQKNGEINQVYETKENTLSSGEEDMDGDGDEFCQDANWEADHIHIQLRIPEPRS